MAKKMTLNDIAAQMAAGFAKHGKDIHDLTETMAFVVERMATKDDLKSLATKADLAKLAEQVTGIEGDLKNIHRELGEINKRLDTLDEHYKNLKGVTREIDDLRADVRAIEKHLGINNKIAA